MAPVEHIQEALLRVRRERDPGRGFGGFEHLILDITAGFAEQRPGGGAWGHMASADEDLRQVLAFKGENLHTLVRAIADVDEPVVGGARP